MKLIIDNWELIVALICIIILSVQKIIEFVDLPTPKKEQEIQEILLEWVRQAECELGSQTGRFKLAQVYEKFCKAYPHLKKWYPLDKFMNLVDYALIEMESSFLNETTKNNALNIKK